jgi:hypothetical protein
MRYSLGVLRRCLLLGGLLVALVPASAGAHALSFRFGSSSVPESAGSLALTVTRTGRGTTPYVSYRVKVADPGTATGGADYTAIAGTLNFGPDTHARTITLPILDDELVEGDETVRLELHDAGPAGDGHLGTYPSTTVTIVDDDSTTRFTASVYRVDEAAGRATVGVARSGSLAGTDTVNFATSDATARAGEDYTATSGTLTFDDGVTEESFEIPITADSDDEDDEMVALALSHPGPLGTHVGTPAVASLSIADDDTTPEPPLVTAVAPPAVTPRRRPPAPIVVALPAGLSASRLARTGRLQVRAGCRSGCTLRARARFGVGARARSMRSGARAVRAGDGTRLTVRLSKRLRTAIRAAIARRGTVRLRVAIAARAPDGGVRRAGRALVLRR